MPLSNWFTRAKPSAPPADLRSRLIAVVAAKDVQALGQLFKDNRARIRDSFGEWTTVPLAMKNDEAALAAYGEMLITVARLFEQEGDDSLMTAIQGDPASSPVEDWNRGITSAQAMVDEGRYAAAAEVLSALLDGMHGIRGSAVDFYRPRVLGKLGVALYQAGDAARARDVTRQARDYCAQIGDEEGVAAYTANLEAMGGG